MSWDCEICGGSRGEDHRICNATSTITGKIDELTEKIDELIQEIRKVKQ